VALTGAGCNRDKALSERFSSSAVQDIDANIAKAKSGSGDLDGAVELARSVLDNVARPSVVWLLQRGSDADLREAAIDRLAAAPVEGGPVPHEIWLLRLRALLARARGDDVVYEDFRDRYRKMATDLGFEGHITMAKAMP
jgi:adenylate cyclase